MGGIGSDATIINFPKSHIVRNNPPRNVEADLEAKVEAQIKEASEALFLILINEYDIDPSQDSFHRDCGLVIGALRACMLNANGIPNRITELVKDIVDGTTEISKEGVI